MLRELRTGDLTHIPFYNNTVVLPFNAHMHTDHPFTTFFVACRILPRPRRLCINEDHRDRTRSGGDGSDVMGTLGHVMQPKWTVVYAVAVLERFFFSVSR